MALRNKETQPLNSPTERNLSPAMARLLQTKPEVDEKLTAFMKTNSDTTALYTQLVREHPEFAVRKLMLNKMRSFEDDLRMAERQLPQVKAWVAENPGMEERIQKRMQNVDPERRSIVYVRIATEILGRARFTPPQQTNGVRV